MILLASASPRRAELLKQIGVPFEQRVVDLDESLRDDEEPAEYVQRLALEKARSAALQVSGNLPVLGADTTVVLEGRVLGKPDSGQHAREMLECLSGRTHTVLTAVALIAATESVMLSESRVTFREITADECTAYCRSGEPLDKAGAYGIQGRAAVFVKEIQGSYSGVMGLPLCETAELLARAGVWLPEVLSGK